MLLDAWVGPEPAESFSGVVDESSKPSGQIRSSALGVHAFRLALSALDASKLFLFLPDHAAYHTRIIFVKIEAQS